MRLVLFAKTPSPGKVKTRLQPVLSASTCANLAEHLIQWTLENALAQWPGQIELSLWPDISHRDSANLRVSISLQQGADLGERMLHVMKQGESTSTVHVVMGCDVPHLPPTILRETWEALSRGKNVVGPADDGGFYLVGLQCVPQSVFNNIQWGQQDVCQQLLENLQFAGMDEPVMLPVVSDIDTPDDLWIVREQFAPLAKFLDTLA